MATVAEIQAELDAQGTNTVIRIIKQWAKSVDATTDLFYCIGGVNYAGRAKWCPTTNTDSAATQATAITNRIASDDL